MIQFKKTESQKRLDDSRSQMRKSSCTFSSHVDEGLPSLEQVPSFSALAARPARNSLSEMVSHENYETAILEEVMMRIECSRRFKQHDLEGSICDTNTKALQKDLEAISSICKRLVTSQESASITLEVGVTQRISVPAGKVPLLARCKVEGESNPIKMKLNYI